MRQVTLKLKRAATIVMSAVMIAGLLPGTVFAANGTRAGELKTAYDATKDYVTRELNKAVANNNLVGSEWYIIGMTRGGALAADSAISKAYYYAVYDQVEKNIKSGEQLSNTPTDNARVIIGLTSLGYDPTNIAGHNLVKGLEDINYATKGLLNSATWSLIALNTNKYAENTRNQLVDHILSKKLADGGWNLSSTYGATADPDTTAMTIQALAPYYSTREDVKDAVDNAVLKLHQIQDENTAGFVTNYGSVNDSSEAIAQVITALSAIGQDSDTYNLFVRNNKTVSLTDSLLRFSVNGGGFKHNPDGLVNGLATAQALYSLTAYYRFKEGKTPLYDMSDVAKQANPEKPVVVKSIKFAKSSYTMTYNNATGGYTGSPLVLGDLLKITTTDKRTVIASSSGIIPKYKITKGENLVDFDYATGKVTPKADANGTVKIRATLQDANKKNKNATVTIKIKGPTKVKSVKVKFGKKSSAKIEKDGEIILNAKCSPTTAKNQNVTFSVNKPELCEFVQEGNRCRVIGKAAGKVKVTATANDGSKKKGSFTLTIKPKGVSSVAINEASEIHIKQGETKHLTATVLPDDASVKTVKWKSRKTAFVKIDKNGYITGKKPGVAEIVVTTKGKNVNNKTVSNSIFVVVDP